MMTIKVMQKGITHLYSGEEVSHEFIRFKDQKDFIKKYNEATNDILGTISIIGIPDHYWEDKEVISNTFLALYFGIDTNGRQRCLILQNGLVYIMQGGQTVDRIVC